MWEPRWGNRVWIGRMLGRKERIGLNHADLAEVGGVDWVGSVEVNCLRWLALTCTVTDEMLGYWYYLRFALSLLVVKDVKIVPTKEEQEMEIAWMEKVLRDIS